MIHHTYSISKTMRLLFASPWLVGVMLLTFSSCKYSSEYQAINANNEFSVSLPSWMKKEEELKPGAALQYANRYRNFYMIGAAEPTTGDLSADMNRHLNILRRSLADAVVTDSMAISLGGLPGVRVEIYGKMSGENVYFSEVLLDGEGKRYHLSIWTRGEHRKLKYKEEITRIFETFKTI